MKTGWKRHLPAILIGLAGILILASPLIVSTQSALAIKLWSLIGAAPPVGRRRVELLQSFGLFLSVIGFWLFVFRKFRLRKAVMPSAALVTVIVTILPIAFGLRFATARHNLLNLEDILRQSDARVSALEGMLNAPRRTDEACMLTGQLEPPPVILRLEADGLTKPVLMVDPNDGTDRFFVVEKPGRIRVIEEGTLLQQPLLDLTSSVLSDETHDSSWEAGLLGLAVHPQFAANGRLFVNYISVGDTRTVIGEYRVPSGSNVADPVSAREILVIPQPSDSHNGGNMVFGPDGYLYVGMGDGKGPPPNPNGQDLGTLLGAILRIDVDAELPYAVPQDNPFVGQQGARPEIWAYGLRNPWRFSFDMCDGSLFAGDVGQATWEEINLIQKGGNYGWPVVEGNECFDQIGLGANSKLSCSRNGYIIPVTVHRQGKEGGSAIGGYVYRGEQIPGLRGFYIFSDFMAKKLWALSEDARAIPRWNRHTIMELPFNPSSFAQDHRGELFVIDYFGGAVYEIDEAPSLLSNELATRE